MNLNHLEYLITVAENGSINRAAQALYVSQPYLSGVIKSVEEELGFPVFRRSSTGVEPTELGCRRWREQSASCWSWSRCVHSRISGRRACALPRYILPFL